MRLKIDVKGLKALKNIAKLSAKAAKLAGNRALKQMRTAAVKEVRAKKAMRTSQLNKSAFLMIPAKGTNLDWTLAISGKAQPVSAYAVRQTKQGVSAKINKGKTSFLKHAFLAVVGGHLGVFFRKGTERLPITQALTTRVSDVFRDDDGTALRVQEVGRAAFVTRWQHEFTRLASPKTSAAE